jgi:hypothetical protein
MRIKENIAEVNLTRNSLRSILSLKLKKYNYLDWVLGSTEPQVGFIAQEVRRVMPHAVKMVNLPRKIVAWMQ